MGLDAKARRLADHLSTVMEEADCCERDSSVCGRLSPQEIKVLRTVGGMECPIMSGIAGAIRLSLSTVTGLVDRLCEKRLVRRDRSADDRRVVQVALTDEGRELHQEALAARAAFARRVLEALDEREQDALVALLEKAARRLRRSPA